MAGLKHKSSISKRGRLYIICAPGDPHPASQDSHQVSHTSRGLAAAAAAGHCGVEIFCSCEPRPGPAPAQPSPVSTHSQLTLNCCRVRGSMWAQHCTGWYISNFSLAELRGAVMIDRARRNWILSSLAWCHGGLMPDPNGEGMIGFEVFLVSEAIIWSSLLLKRSAPQH